MANSCFNNFHLSCDKNLNKYIDFFKFFHESVCIDYFDYIDYYDSDYHNDQNFENGNLGGFFEGSFESRWNFPMNLKEQLKNLVEEDDNLYFRCLSEEYGCGYVAMNIYKNGSWREEQSFNL